MTAARASGKARWFTPANLLTMSRVVIAPFAVREIVRKHPKRAFGLLFLAGITDLLDGLAARGMSAETKFGQLLDPIADKVLLSGVYAGLARTATVPGWFVGIVFGRDVLLLASSAAVLSLTQYRDLKPTFCGKTSTLFQIGNAGILVLANASNSDLARNIGLRLLWPTAFLTVLSGAQYGWRGLLYFGYKPGSVDDRFLGE